MTEQDEKQFAEPDTAMEATVTDTSAVEAVPEDHSVRLQELEAQVKTNYELYLRALAELDNFKKRTQKDHEELVHYSNASLIKKLLPILDDFDRALGDSGNHQDFVSLHKGLTMIHKNLYEMLAGEGVEPVKAVGGEFDPQFHQPLMVEASDQGENIVLEEFQKGYLYKNRLLRPSLVKVSQ